MEVFYKYGPSCWLKEERKKERMSIPLKRAIEKRFGGALMHFYDKVCGSKFPHSPSHLFFYFSIIPTPTFSFLLFLLNKLKTTLPSFYSIYGIIFISFFTILHSFIHSFISFIIENYILGLFELYLRSRWMKKLTQNAALLK